jgi:hypothetical protein
MIAKEKALHADLLQKQEDRQARGRLLLGDGETEALTDSLSLANAISSNHLEVG